MLMPPGLRKFVLTTHVLSSIGWVGGVACFAVLAVSGLTSADAQQVRAAYVAMDVITRFVIVPFALASLLTGIVQSLGTKWGLFRHYWVVIKLVITVVAVAVLLLKVGEIRFLAETATQRALSSGDLQETRSSLVLHSLGGLALLLVPTVLSVYKPRGMTRYGQRKARGAGQRDDPQAALSI